MTIAIFETLKKEFQVNEKGITFTSKRGLARLCGVKSQVWGRYGYLFTKDIDLFIAEELEICSDSHNDVNNQFSLKEALTHKGFILSAKAGFIIQDIVASLVIEFYANQKKIHQAKLTNRALRAIGLRTAIQTATRWNKPKREYGHLLLSAPRVWTKVFGDEFYDELSRLTGLDWDRKTHQRPCIFAQLTYELVYSHLPLDAYETIKRHQKEHGGYLHKMHQFLNEDGLNALVNHLNLTLNILNAVSSLKQAKLLVHQATTRTYQQSLFG